MFVGIVDFYSILYFFLALKGMEMQSSNPKKINDKNKSGNGIILRVGAN